MREFHLILYRKMPRGFRCPLQEYAGVAAVYKYLDQGVDIRGSPEKHREN